MLHNLAHPTILGRKDYLPYFTYDKMSGGQVTAQNLVGLRRHRGNSNSNLLGSLPLEGFYGVAWMKKRRNPQLPDAVVKENSK